MSNEIKLLISQCEANVTSFDNDQMSSALSEIQRLHALVGRAVRGLKTLGRFHYPDDGGVEPHSLDCTLAGRVSRVFCTGMTRSCELCHEFGEDPEYSEARNRKLQGSEE